MTRRLEVAIACGAFVFAFGGSLVSLQILQTVRDYQRVAAQRATVETPSGQTRILGPHTFRAVGDTATLCAVLETGSGLALGTPAVLVRRISTTQVAGKMRHNVHEACRALYRQAGIVVTDDTPVRPIIWNLQKTAVTARPGGVGT